MENAERDLEAIRQILGMAETEYFLEYGTLLGAYRDGDFLEGDHDIDIGVYGLEKLNEVRELAKIYGFQIKDPKQYLSLRRDVAVDIHFYEEKLNCYQCFIKKGKPYLFFPKRFRGLSKFIFKGKVWNIPQDTEGYLKWVYGDWKDKNNKKSAAQGWKQKQL